MIRGFARVSTDSQSVDAQVKQLRAARAEKVCRENASGARRPRAIAPRPRLTGRARTSEGRERAKAKGVKLGRKPKLTDHQKREAIRRRDHGDETLVEIGRSYDASGWTIARLAP